MKEKEEERKANQPEEDFDEVDEDEEFDGFGNSDDFDDEDGEEQDVEEGDSRQSSSNDGAEKNEDDELIDGDARFNYDNIEEDKIRAFTDDAFKQNEKKLFAENAKNYLYANIPEFDTKKGILTYKSLYKKYREYIAEWPSEATRSSNEKYQKLRKETNKVVSYLVKEFELRKNAEQLKRASTAKTGDLDMKKIFAYQFSEDIFKKISVVPNGKSHGLVMFLDWSGSMSDHIENTVKQLLSLVMFCKKVNIPYEVYAFATPESYASHDYTITPKDGDLQARNFYLMNLLSSKMTAGEAKKSGKPRKAPKVAPPKPINGNFMREADVIRKRTSAQQPMKAKRLSK
jgi:hypothetical protein